MTPSTGPLSHAQLDGAGVMGIEPPRKYGFNQLKSWVSHGLSSKNHGLIMAFSSPKIMAFTHQKIWEEDGRGILTSKKMNLADQNEDLAHRYGGRI